MVGSLSDPRPRGDPFSPRMLIYARLASARGSARGGGSRGISRRKHTHTHTQSQPLACLHFCVILAFGFARNGGGDGGMSRSVRMTAFTLRGEQTRTSFWHSIPLVIAATTWPDEPIPPSILTSNRLQTSIKAETKLGSSVIV